MGHSPGCRERQESGMHRGMHKENTSPKPLPGKMRGADFLIFVFCNQWGSKSGVLEIRSLGWDSDLRALPYSWREGRQATLEQTVWSEDHIDTQWEDCSLFLKCICERWHCPSRDKAAHSHHFTTPPPPPAQAQRQVLQVAKPDTDCLACSATNPTLLHSGTITLLGQTCFGPSMARPSPRRPMQVPATPGP